MNFAMLSNYHISKIPPIYSLSAIKPAMLVFYMKCSETQVVTSSLID